MGLVSSVLIRISTPPPLGLNPTRPPSVSSTRMSSICASYWTAFRISTHPPIYPRSLLSTTASSRTSPTTCMITLTQALRQARRAKSSARTPPHKRPRNSKSHALRAALQTDALSISTFRSARSCCTRGQIFLFVARGFHLKRRRSRAPAPPAAVFASQPVRFECIH